MMPSESPPPAQAGASDAAPSSAPQADPVGPGWERALLEKLAFAALQEQRAARRWRNVWRLVWLLAFGAVAWLLYRDVVPPTPTTTPHTALIELRGEIGRTPRPAPATSCRRCVPRSKIRVRRPSCC